MIEINKPSLYLIIGYSFPQIMYLNYKFTDYSLNTELSFKIENQPHLTAFIKKNHLLNKDEKQLLKNVLNLRESAFLFINFYKKNL